MASREHDTAVLGALSSPMSGEHRPRMAKADLRKAEMQQDWREQVGSAIERARVLSGLSLKEFAGAIGRDERQIAKWIGGIERPQFDAIFAVKELRGPLVIALAELSQTVEVQTTLTIRRTA
jgi:ribosome-binding protein aMBF1 (putative translation factor)